MAEKKKSKKGIMIVAGLSLLGLLLLGSIFSFKDIQNTLPNKSELDNVELYALSPDGKHVIAVQKEYSSGDTQAIVSISERGKPFKEKLSFEMAYLDQYHLSLLIGNEYYAVYTDQYIEGSETVKGICKIFSYEKPKEVESAIEEGMSKEDCAATFGYYDFPLEDTRYIDRFLEDYLYIKEINASIKEEQVKCIPDSCQYKTTIDLPGATYEAEGGFELSQNGHLIDNNGNLVVLINKSLYRVPPIFLED